MPRRNKHLVHVPFRFGSSCAQKRRFATERQANEAADYQMLLKMDLVLSTYKCELCGGWHLTRQTKNS